MPALPTGRSQVSVQDVLLAHAAWTLGGVNELASQIGAEPADADFQGIVNWCRAVDLATTGPLEGSAWYIDGVPPRQHMRVLVKDEPDFRKNGVYVVDLTGSAKPELYLRRIIEPVPAGSAAYVCAGNSNGESSWVLVECGPDPPKQPPDDWLHKISDGRWALPGNGASRTCSWEMFSGPGSVTVGHGLVKLTGP